MNTFQRVSLRLFIVTVFTMLVVTPHVSRADTSAFTPPFTNGWLTPDAAQIDTWTISKRGLNYAGTNSIGALDLMTGKRMWEWHDENHIVAASAFDGSRLYSVIYEFGIIADDAATGKRIWTLPVTTDINTMCVDNNTIFVELRPGHITALNASNHKTIWEAPLAPMTSKTPLMINRIVAVGHQKLLVLAATPDSVQAGAYTILCLSPSSGRVLWRTPVVPSGGDWAVSCVTNANSMYAVFANGGIKAYSLQTGAVKWAQSGSGASIILDGRQIVSILDGTVVAVDCATGRKTWSITLSKQVEAPFSKPSLHGSDIWVVGNGCLYCIASSGTLRWKYTLEDATPTQPVFVSDGFLLPIGGSLTMFHHGSSHPLPTSSADRQALATGLVSRLDGLSIIDKHKLIALGDDAFPALLTELKKRIAAYYSAKKPDYEEFSNCADDLSAVMQPKFTQSILDLLPMAPRLNGDDSIRQELLGILADKGDTALTLNLFITILKTEKPDWSYRFDATSIALEVIRTSELPGAVAYLVSSLNDSDTDSYIRHVAYESAATTGDPSAVKAVLASRNYDRSTASLSIIMGLEQLGVDPSPNPNAQGTALLATSKDAGGQLWGLVQSGVAGAGDDLWIVKYDGTHWTEPMLTSLTQSTLGSLSNFIKFVGDTRFTQDTDGDGWTDLLERRIGTNPASKDTDNDGLLDGTDKNPLTGREPQTETERVLAAAFEAHFWFPTIRPRPCLVTFPKGIKPFELFGSNWLIIGVTDRDKLPLSANWDRGTAFVDFDPPMRDFAGQAYKSADPKSIVLWNVDHTRARVLIREYYGGLNGTGSDMELRKFGSDWVVVKEDLAFQS